MTTDSQLFRLSPETRSGHQRTLAEHVAADLHAAILRREFPGGSALRINDLAERFETSAMPVREALRRLAGLGLVEILPHRGARVLELSVEDLEDTYRVRRALEPLALHDAATRITETQLFEAAAALERHENHLDAGDVESARQAHTDFHFLLYRAAGSPWLLRAIEPVWQNSERYRFASGDTDRVRSHGEHEELLTTCRAHKPEAAHEAMERHLNGALARLRSSMA
jgi:DNA-binding GntR family transcriptional regulator